MVAEYVSQCSRKFKCIGDEWFWCRYPSGASPTVSQTAGLQLGPCFVCGKLGHFKKSCPVWVRAQSAAASTS